MSNDKKILRAEVLSGLGRTTSFASERREFRAAAWEVFQTVPRASVRAWWDTSVCYEDLRREFAPQDPDLYADAPPTVHRPSWLTDPERFSALIGPSIPLQRGNRAKPSAKKTASKSSRPPKKRVVGRKKPPSDND